MADRDEMDKAVRTLCRRVASVIIRAMALRDMSFQEIDERIGRPRGFTKRQVLALSEGRASRVGLRTLGECGWALDVEIGFEVTGKRPALTEER